MSDLELTEYVGCMYSCVLFLIKKIIYYGYTQLLHVGVVVVAAASKQNF